MINNDSIDSKVEKEKSSVADTVKEYIKIIIAAIILSFIISIFVKPAQVVGDSMNGNLHNNDMLLLNKIAYKSHSPNYKDIVVIRANINDAEYIVKRVIGTPGDKIQIKDNQVYVNGKVLDEKYIKEPMANNMDMDIEVPDGKIFVMGDNRNNSLDSRDPSVGLVDYKEAVVGKVMFRMYPFKGIPKY
ncbi:signal peptidase I [Clostridium sp. 'White wine YQ']|uniref:signal peptidase I n=1 Tax=Clostridium sp. 'White wine YQ' TaxID=3027474 RepID=UPI0023670E47|nr:signal peptidase I [Clostridium sp. 'White wine YQ']MDD7794468.1 signal peptidase I [Clostridium sp. 'White wine YQ']